MEHRLAEPKTETIGQPKRKSAFDMIENPEKGWTTALVSRTQITGEEVVWAITLEHEADRASVSFEAESLYVAWARATEQAHMMNIGLA